MNNKKTMLYSSVSNLRLRFAVVSSVLWLCALFSWIYFCPKYLPDGEYLLFSNFESRPANTAGKSELVIEPWHHSTKGVVWESECDSSRSACIKLLSDGETSSYMKWTLANPQRYSFLEFQGKMRTENIVVGENEWDAARFLVYFTDKDGKGRWDYPHAVVRLLGTHPWQEYSKIFPVPDFAVTANVFIQNSSKSGTIWCDDISLRPAHLNSAYFHYKNALIFSGAILGIGLIIISNLWKRGGRIPLILLVMIILGTLWSNADLEIYAGKYQINLEMIKKFGHLTLFFLLGLVSTRRLGARVKAKGSFSLPLPYPILIFGGLLLFAALTEFVQFLSIGRHPSIKDVLIDMVGIIAGISIGRSYGKKAGRKR